MIAAVSGAAEDGKSIAHHSGCNVKLFPVAAARTSREGHDDYAILVLITGMRFYGRRVIDNSLTKSAITVIDPVILTGLIGFVFSLSFGP